MIVVFSEQHKADLAILSSQPVSVVSQFCKLTLEFIRKGSYAQDKKKLASAAKQLGLPLKSVESALQALCFLFLEASKLNLREKDFAHSLVPLEYPQEHNDCLKNDWLASKDEIRQLLLDTLVDLPHFVELDWRLDIQLASRSSRNLLSPLFLIHLKTTVGDSDQENVATLQTDYANLKHITKELETALDTMKQVFATRVSRNVNI